VGRQAFELATELIRPGGRVANVGVHGHSANFPFEKLWIRDVTITTGLVDTRTIPELLRLIGDGRLDPSKLISHRYPLADTMEAYDVLADASHTDALKIVLDGATKVARTESKKAHTGSGRS
jgi:alcohol dehydrogenase